MKRFCGRCPQRGRLLPSRKGWVKCVECDGETVDAWGLTDNLSQGDYDAAMAFARQLRETRKRQRECEHLHVTVAVHPWCSDCGLVLPKDHPMTLAVRKRYPLQPAVENAQEAMAQFLAAIGKAPVSLAQFLTAIGKAPASPAEPEPAKAVRERLYPDSSEPTDSVFDDLEGM